MSIPEFWDDTIVPTLVEYIALPAKSAALRPGLARNGHIDAAVELAEAWCRAHAIDGMKLEVVRLAGRTPVLLVEVPATRAARAPCSSTATSTSSRR